LVGNGAQGGQHAYLLVLPDGRRFHVTRPLYHLARLLARHVSLSEVATSLSECVARPLGQEEVAALIARRLAPLGIARRPAGDRKFISAPNDR
jgi:hypothetical protein